MGLLKDSDTFSQGLLTGILNVECVTRNQFKLLVRFSQRAQLLFGTLQGPELDRGSVISISVICFTMFN